MKVGIQLNILLYRRIFYFRTHINRSNFNMISFREYLKRCVVNHRSWSNILSRNFIAYNILFVQLKICNRNRLWQKWSLLLRRLLFWIFLRNHHGFSSIIQICFRYQNHFLSSILNFHILRYLTLGQVIT